MASRSDRRTKKQFMDHYKERFQRDLNALTEMAQANLKHDDNATDQLYEDLVHFYMKSLHPFREYLDGTSSPDSTLSGESLSPQRKKSTKDPPTVVKCKQKLSNPSDVSEDYSSDSSSMPSSTFVESGLAYPNDSEESDGYVTSYSSVESSSRRRPAMPGEESENTGISPKLKPAHLKDLVQRIHCRMEKDTYRFGIEDVKLLPDGHFLVADRRNQCVKLFSSQGRRVNSIMVPECYFLAVMDPNSTAPWTVAVSTGANNVSAKSITVMEVKPPEIEQVKAFQLKKDVFSIAAIDKDTLAVVYVSSSHGICLLNLTNGVQRLLKGSESLGTRTMTATDNGHLVVITEDETVAKINILENSIVFNRKVSNIEDPFTISSLEDRHCILSNRNTDSLHLITAEGGWVKKLWALPDGKGRKMFWGVSATEDLCLVWLENGEVFLFDFV